MIQFRHTIDCENSKISNSRDINDFYFSMHNPNYKHNFSERIFVWTDFAKQISTDLFKDSSWQKNFVGLFSNQEFWPWKFKFSRNEIDQIGNQNLMEALESPRKEIIASLKIRDFESDDLHIGSPQWLENIDFSLNTQYNQSKVFLGYIIESILAAWDAGICLFLEKISVMVSHDPHSSITLTPHLHRDGAYGELESALVSFYSEELTPNASTLFFPDFDFEAFSHLKPITAEKLINQFPNSLAYSLASGNLAVFSGKLGKDGIKDDRNGALHISPEGFFPTRRLALLFRSKIL